MTILARYTEKGGGELPALIQAGGDVTLERCAFMVAGEVKGTGAVSTEGGKLTATGCWFEGFDRAMDVAAYAGSEATIRQCMIVRTGPEAAPGGWAVRVRYAESTPKPIERQLRMDRCTVFGHGLMELVDFSAGSKYKVHITDTAVRANALLSWTPAPPDLPLSREVLDWSGRGNQYDVRGTAWVVLAVGGEPGAAERADRPGVVADAHDRGQTPSASRSASGSIPRRNPSPHAPGLRHHQRGPQGDRGRAGPGGALGRTPSSP